jgi:hypothetical protein
VIIVSAGCGGEPPRALYEEAGGFSYDPPAGWEIVEFPGLKYRISHGQPESGFAPNINVVDEDYSGSLPAYVDANLLSMEEMFVGFEVLSRSDLTTEDGQAAIKLVTETEQQGRRLRQTFYFLGSGDTKYVVTCSALAESAAALDSLFDTSVATFRIH